MSEERSDEDLMIAYRNGEVRAFSVLVVRHQKGVYNFVRRHAGNDRAEDLLQEVFLRVIRSARGYQRTAKFTTWLYTIARNLCVDALRRASHRQAQSLDAPRGDDERGTLGDTVADPAPGTDRAAMDREMTARLERAIAALPEEQREVFLLREREGLPFLEIAKAVGCPENTVKSRMRYALERLRAALADFADSAPEVKS